MRRKLSARLVIISALTVVSLAIAGQFFASLGSRATGNAEADERDPLLLEIAKYRQWKLVNPIPVMMDPAAAAACAIAFPVNPHQTAFVSVYVNAKGASAMMTEAHPVFPEGSIIVKEKLSDKTSQKPTLLTVMIKREKGYNPESRDWDYLVLDGPASKILDQGKLSSCNGCHQAYIDTDFVTRHYLPDSDRRTQR